MLPQRVHEEGGYRKKGRTMDQVEGLLEGAHSLVEAGVFAIVLESIIPSAAHTISDTIPVPTIGIGCGEHTCDGEIAVLTDVIGSYPWFVPPFATQRANVADTISSAVTGYINACQPPK